MSSSSTISVATMATPPAPPSGPDAPTSSSCHPTAPNLNSIEQVFAKLKHLMRGAQPRTVEETWRKAGRRLQLFTANECAMYLKNAGYGSV